jgi:hypothetical protein
MLAAMSKGTDGPRLKPGYNVWFGLQHVTLTGFRHAGRRENCVKCNPSLQPGASSHSDDKT